MMSQTGDVRLPVGICPTLRVVPMPADTNAYGSVFGGWIMAQIDIAASIPAIHRAGGRVATVSVDSMEFHQPVFVGDRVSLYAEISRVGRTSLAIHVDVYAERCVDDHQVILVTKADLNFVALDEHRRPRPLPAEQST